MRTPGDQLDRHLQRREVMLDMRRLPSQWRSMLRRVRNPYVLQGVLDRINEDLDALASTQMGVGVEGLHEADRHRLLERLASQKGYGNRVRRFAHEQRRLVHVGWVQRSDREVLPSRVPNLQIPNTATWSVDEDVGLGTAPFLEAMPDELALGLVQDLIRRTRTEAHQEAWTEVAAELGVDGGVFDPVGLDDVPDTSLDILVIGAGPSTVPFAVDALHDPSIRIRIVEIDPIVSERETLSVVGREDHLADVLRSGDRFDAVVVHLPAPAQVGAEKHRFIYYADQVPKEDQPRLGRRRWRQSALRTLRVLPLLLRVGGVVHVYSPNGIRRRRHYDIDKTLTVGFTDVLATGGFHIVRDIEVLHKARVAQPFVAHERCPWRLVSATLKEAHRA